MYSYRQIIFTLLLTVAAIAYAGYAVATNRHGAFDRLQALEVSRLPGLNRDKPNAITGVVTPFYLVIAQ